MGKVYIVDATLGGGGVAAVSHGVTSSLGFNDGVPLSRISIDGGHALYTFRAEHPLEEIKVETAGGAMALFTLEITKASTP